MRGSFLFCSGVSFWALCSGLPPPQVVLVYRCLHEVWGFDVLPQGVAEVIADVVRDFTIRLSEWMNFFFFFLTRKALRSLWWRQSFLLWMGIVFSLRCFLDRSLVQPETNDPWLDQTVVLSSCALPLICCMTLGKSFTFFGPQLPHL